MANQYKKVQNQHTQAVDIQSQVLNIEYYLSGFAFPTKVWLAIPPNLPGQVVRLEKIQPQPHRIFEIKPNKVAYFELEKGEDIRLQMQVITHEISTPQSGDVKESYLSDEPFINITQEIRDLAAIIVGEIKDRKEQARLLFTWVRDNIKYKHPPKTWGNIAALQTKSGDCGSSSFLFVSLCRALEIPSRVIFGRIVSNEGKSTPHAWAECYIDGWIPVDCSISSDVKRPLFSICDYFGMPSDPDYYFGHLDNKRIAYSIGTGIDPVVPYPKIVSKNGYMLHTDSGNFLWGKELFHDRIPFLQPVYYASKDERITQGKLRIRVPLRKKVVDPIMAKLCPLLIPVFAIISLVSIYGIILVIGTILSMLIGNILTWKGKTRVFWASIMAVVLIILVFTIGQ
jgi:hypothetical protein